MLKPGSLVLLRNSARDGRKGDKFQARYLGPYEIAKQCFQTAQPHNGPSAQEECECLSSEAISQTSVATFAPEQYFTVPGK